MKILQDSLLEIQILQDTDLRLLNWVYIYSFSRQ